MCDKSIGFASVTPEDRTMQKQPFIFLITIRCFSTIGTHCWLYHENSGTTDNFI